VETAQAALKRMVRDELGPRLRALGFKGSSGVYLLSDPDNFAQLGVQGWRYNSASEARFTVNVSVISRSAWQMYRENNPWVREDKPSANAHYGPDGPWVERLGWLIDGGIGDKWWSVFNSQPVAPIAEEVARAVERWAIPAIRDQIRQGGHP
jgi:hypothetical protein